MIKQNKRVDDIDFTFNNWVKVLGVACLVFMVVYSAYPWIVELFA